MKKRKGTFQSNTFPISVSIIVLFLLTSVDSSIASNIDNTNDSNGISLNNIKQKRIVKGVVKDEDGQSLPGATIIIVGSAKGVITDNDGRYSIEVEASDVLEYSFVGLETELMKVGNNTVLDVVLKEKIDELDEVVVVAFGKQKKTDVIGSVTSVTAKELKMPSSNLTNSLAGKLSGVIAYQRSGEPGLDNAEFFIRGVTSFGYKVDPLILIDGIELSSTELARLIKKFHVRVYHTDTIDTTTENRKIEGIFCGL